MNNLCIIIIIIIIIIQVVTFVTDNTSQDGDSAGVAEAAHSRRHPAPNAGPRHPPMFAVNNPAMEAEDNPGWSTLETSDSQFTT